MIIAYSGRSAPSAQRIAEVHGDTLIRRSNDRSDVNWGRNHANAELNPDITNATNKRVMRQLFAEHEVPMPRLLNTQQARSWVLDGNAVIGRPDTHSKGRGLWKCNSLSGIDRALQGTRRKRAATHFMEFVEAAREYRVHVFKGKSIRISEKDFTEDGEYVTRKPQHEIRHVRNAAKEAVAALGLDFGAVDILATDDQCWVLEVNAAPGVGGTMPQLYADTFHRWNDGEWEE